MLKIKLWPLAHFFLYTLYISFFFKIVFYKKKTGHLAAKPEKASKIVKKGPKTAIFAPKWPFLTPFLPILLASFFRKSGRLPTFFGRLPTFSSDKNALARKKWAQPSFILQKWAENQRTIVSFSNPQLGQLQV